MKLSNWQVYVITPEISIPSIKEKKFEVITSYLKKIEEAILGSADVVQFRAENLSDRDYYEIGKKLCQLTRKYSVPLIVNNRLDLALAISADGLHLGQDDLPISEVKKIVIRYPLSVGHFVIGVSTHSLAQAVQAEKDGADYISIGPIFSTPLKPEYKPLGLGIIGEIKKRIKIPFFAIGGINQDNLQEVISAGAERIAVIRAVFGQKNIRQGTKELKELLSSSIPNQVRL